MEVRRREKWREKGEETEKENVGGEKEWEDKKKWMENGRKVREKK